MAAKSWFVERILAGLCCSGYSYRWKSSIVNWQLFLCRLTTLTHTHTHAHTHTQPKLLSKISYTHRSRILPTVMSQGWLTVDSHNAFLCEHALLRWSCLIPTSSALLSDSGSPPQPLSGLSCLRLHDQLPLGEAWLQRWG